GPPRALVADVARRLLAPPPLPGRAASRHDPPGGAAIPARHPARTSPRRRRDRIGRRSACWAPGSGRSSGQRGRRDDRARTPAPAGPAAGSLSPSGALGPPLAGAAASLLGELPPGAPRGVAASAGAGGATGRRNRSDLHPPPPRPRSPPRAARA